jgi:hypothetical protein
MKERFLLGGCAWSLIVVGLLGCSDSEPGDDGTGSAGAGSGAAGASGSGNAGSGAGAGQGASGGASSGPGSGGSGAGGQPMGCVDAEPDGVYGLDGHTVTALPAGIGFHAEDYGEILHVSDPGTWEHAAGAAFDGRGAVRFHPGGIVEGYSAIRELHMENMPEAITQLNARWLVHYSGDAHTQIKSKHTIIVRQNDPFELRSGRAMTIWQTDPIHDGMALGPCDGIVCSYVDADPPYWPDGSDTFWVGPAAGGGYAEQWVSFEHEFVARRPRPLSGAPSPTCTTVAGSDHVLFEGAQLGQDIQVKDTLVIADGPDAMRYIVEEIVSDNELRVSRVPPGAGEPTILAGGEGSYEFSYGYSRLYIHTQDGAFAGAYHELPLWDTGAWGEMAYLDIVGMYGGATGNPWFMLDRFRMDDEYIGPPCGFVRR